MTDGRVLFVGFDLMAMTVRLNENNLHMLTVTR